MKPVAQASLEDAALTAWSPSLAEGFGLFTWEQAAAVQRRVRVSRFPLVSADVLAERYASRLRAAGSIGRGRSVEDQVEKIVDDLKLPRQMRTQFRGRGGQTAPCDLAIPEGGQRAQIVCGIKGFDSTGSKLTDAAREIEAMAEVRLPNQYVFAVVDGIGWLSRQADLRRIHALWDRRSIDGLYTLSGLAEFRADLEAAARRLELLSD